MKSLDQQACYHELLTRLARLRDDSPRQWGKMSANQMVCHLTDSFRGIMGELSLAPCDNLFSRTVMKWGGLWAPMKWPQCVPTRPEMDQLIGGTPPTTFEVDVDALKSSMLRFRATPRDFNFVKHPIFGPMTDREWMRWGYLHVDHHLRQFGLP